MPGVLVVDDDPEVRRLLADLLGDRGLEVAEAGDGEEGVALIVANAPSLVILDIAMPKLDGLGVLRRLRALGCEVPVIILTASGDIGTAVEAMRLGAWDYLPKPFDPEELTLHVRRALDWQALRAEIDTLKRELAAGNVANRLLGSSREIQDVIARVRQVAGSRLTVVVQGETGTGKELVARAIHEQSDRREGPFIAVDCGAIPDTLVDSEMFGHEKGAFTGAERRKEGRFQLADGGTLFLDEVANLPLPTQARLLRVLQEREVWPIGSRAPVPVDVRVVVATNVSLDDEVRAGRFRQDLFYRLSEFAIVLPPLRGRRGDVLPLARHFLAEASMELKRSVRGFSLSAEARLGAHDWPGNVRELRNVVRRAVVLASDVVEAEHLEIGNAVAPAVPDAHGTGSAITTLKEARNRAVMEAEREAIRAALEAARGNKSEAARLLHVDYKTIHTKIRQYGLRPQFGAS